MSEPEQAYRRRLEHWRAVSAREQRLFRVIGNWRLATGVAAAVLAWLAFANGVVSGWWLLAPLAIFVVLVIIHERVAKRGGLSARASAYYERGLARLEGRWVGTGNQGERFRDPGHVYADDLDLFGRGSLFEMLATARTASGERVLAEWLLAPGSLDEVRARQQAAEELKPRVDLREDLALLGEDIRAGVHTEMLEKWGSAAVVRFLPGARQLAFALAVAAVITFVAFMAQLTGSRPFLAVLLAEVAFSFAVRRQSHNVVASVQAPAHELALLSLLLERLERERFSSPRLVALRAALEAAGHAASRQIARLERLIDYLDWARNQFFRIFASALLWIPQFAMAIEVWRRRSGPSIGRWMAVVGEMEALCSLAAYAYEHPEARFPTLLAEGEPRFEAEDLRHPLLPFLECVPNHLSLGGERRLLIVSGSNMSGKSTLLRAAGLNTVLAWAGAPVPSGRLQISAFQVGASLRTVDSLQDKRSRFYAEISRLRQIVDLTAGPRPVLFLLDELLSGTNSHDRRIGAEAVVRGLLERGAIGLVTTHDLALADIAAAFAPRAENVHFEDHLEDGRISFDYKMRPGVVRRSNALELMRAVGLDV